MKHLLSRTHIELLTHLSWSRLLLAFDFDGTLAPIVRDRGAAVMRQTTSRLFARVCELYPCAVISGRSRVDVSRRLGAACPQRVVGNHGIEPGTRIRAFEHEVAHVLPALTAALDEEQGVDIEDKRYSLAIHYSRARQKRRALARIRAAVSGVTPQMRIVPGKLVVNVLPAAAPHKGDALSEARARSGMDTALYVGDDVTDEDVFALDEPGRLFTVRVGQSTRSLASYYLRNQHEIDTLLKLLVELRKDRARHDDPLERGSPRAAARR